MKHLIGFFAVLITYSCFALPVSAKSEQVSSALSSVQMEWAQIKYQEPDKQMKLKALDALDQKLQKLVAENPQSAEAKIWEAIVLSTYANIMQSLSALPKVEKAKTLLEEAMKSNPRAMNGYAQMTLGALYYQVPGWPISFGNNKKAESYLKEALTFDPQGMDTNYWYGSFLLYDDRADDALIYLQKAIDAPIRGDRVIADKGRKNEIAQALSKAQKEVAQNKR